LFLRSTLAGEFSLPIHFFRDFEIFICLNCFQVFIGRAASFSELHDSGTVHSAAPSAIATVGGTIVTLLGTNLCRRGVSVAVEGSPSIILHISSNSILLQTPAGLNHRPFLNLSYSSMWCVSPAGFPLTSFIQFEAFALQAQ
jgi:hypothetical protein